MAFPNGGDGSSGNPWRIETAADWELFANPATYATYWVQDKYTKVADASGNPVTIDFANAIITMAGMAKWNNIWKWLL